MTPLDTFLTLDNRFAVLLTITGRVNLTNTSSSCLPCKLMNRDKTSFDRMRTFSSFWVCIKRDTLVKKSWQSLMLARNLNTSESGVDEVNWSFIQVSKGMISEGCSSCVSLAGISRSISADSYRIEGFSGGRVRLPLNEDWWDCLAVVNYVAYAINIEFN